MRRLRMEVWLWLSALCQSRALSVAIKAKDMETVESIRAHIALDLPHVVVGVDVATGKTVTVADDVMARSVSRAFNTGEVVVWNEGDPLPDPAGPVRKVEE